MVCRGVRGKLLIWLQVENEAKAKKQAEEDRKKQAEEDKRKEQQAKKAEQDKVSLSCSFTAFTDLTHILSQRTRLPGTSVVHHCQCDISSSLVYINSQDLYSSSSSTCADVLV